MSPNNDAPGWTDDAALGWSPERELALTPPRPVQRAGPWSPAVEKAEAEETPAHLAWPWRLGLGLAQGFLFFLLFHSRALGQWPGSDPFLFDAVALPLLFAPWLLMAGLGAIALPRLLAFAALAAAILAALGWYQRWRIFGVAHGQPGLSLLVLAGLALFIAQAFLQAREAAGGWRIPYGELFRTSWTLAARLCLLLLALGAALVLVHSPLMPRLTLERGDPIAMPLLGLAGALAFQLTAALPRFTAALTAALVASATVTLPLAVAAAILILGAALADGAPALLFLLAVMSALLTAIGASHRGGAGQSARRDGFEFFAALLLTALAGLAAWALAVRVAALGWTAPRLFAACAVGLLGAYGLGYSAAAVIGLVRGDGLKRLAAVNVVLGLVTMVGALALASPLADPLRLATQAQAARLEQGRVAVARFDFANLPRDGARFGNAALAALGHSLYPDIAHAAREAAAVTGVVAPNPTEIGANIAVRTPGARLPAALLARDWSHVVGVPPCLTRAAERCEAFFIDLDGDDRPEILLVTGGQTRWWGAVMQADAAGRWALAGRLAAGCGATLSDLRAGHFSVLAALPGWSDLQIAGARLSVTPNIAGCSHY